MRPVGTLSVGVMVSVASRTGGSENELLEDIPARVAVAVPDSGGENVSVRTRGVTVMLHEFWAVTGPVAVILILGNVCETVRASMLHEEITVSLKDNAAGISSSSVSSTTIS